MSKAVLISIHPKWCELIASGEKTLEVRKTKPKLETPFKCYIYCTKSDDMLWVLNTISRREYGISAVCANLKDAEGAIRGDGKIIGEFVCDDCSALCKHHLSYIDQYGLLPKEKLFEYLGISENQDLTFDCMGFYGWHITHLVIYDKPKELCEFMKPCESDLYCEVCAMFREFEDRCGNKALMLSRAPQSWCYVEELKGGDG